MGDWRQTVGEVKCACECVYRFGRVAGMARHGEERRGACGVLWSPCACVCPGGYCYPCESVFCRSDQWCTQGCLPVWGERVAIRY